MPSDRPSLLALVRPTNLLALLVLAGLGYGALVAYRIYVRAHRDEQSRRELEQAVDRLQTKNVELQQAVSDLEAQNAELRTFVDRLTTETRIAEVFVLEQHPGPDGVPLTTLEFTELDRAGRPLPTRVFTVRGREVYFDALVIKFSEEEVKVGDPLRGKSLHLFRRVFGEAQAPREGVLLATARSDGVPDFYRLSPGGQPSDFEQRMWEQFWHWADHPAEAAREGVRVPQIEAVGIRPRPGARYRISLEHDGGPNIRRIEEPQE
jgi:hypothetical protein